jgi:hypothetical protein
MPSLVNFIALMFTVVLQYACNPASSDSSKQIDTGSSITIDVDVTNPQPVNPLLYGFSTSSLYWQMDATNDTFVDAVKALKPRLLRFPGGTQAQFFHWDKPGYGFDYNEVNAQHPQYAKSLEQQNAFTPRKAGRSYTDDFIDLAKQTNADVMICANMLTGSVDELKGMLAHFKQRGANVVAVELGNEMYLPKLKQYYKTPQAYIDACKPYAQMIRRDFPGVKVGVTAAPSLRITDESNVDSESQYFKQFNQALAAETFYDAYIAHYYFPFDCSGVSDDCSMQAMDDAIYKQLPQAFDYYNKTFGAKREQWITEWNIAQNQTNGRYGNTALQAHFIQLFHHQLNALNATRNGMATMATYQTLGGDILASATIMEPYKREAYRDALYGRFVRRSTWYANVLMDPVFTKPLKRVNATTTPADENIQVFAYVDERSKTVFVYVVNGTGVSLNIDALRVGGKKIKQVTATLLNANDASDGFGFNKTTGTPAQAKNQMTFVVQQAAGLPFTFTNFGCGYLQATY